MGKYTLKQGENIWDVASLYGTTAEELARLNNTNDPFSIKKNMTINVPDLDVGETASVASEGDGGNSGGVVMPNKPVANYNTTSWNNTAKGKEAWDAYETARDKVTNYEYSNQKQLDEIMNSILNRDKFNYNFNEDAFYQMYKDKYHKQGKMAAANVMGQAAAMTGGYGNSYAATVGNQAYQASLQNLNDIIPELYQMAYDKYNQEGQDLYNKYGLLNSDYEREYGQLMDILGIRKSDYYDGSNIYYNDVSLKNQAEEARYKSALAEYEAAMEEIRASEDANKIAQLSGKEWNEILDATDRYAEEGEKKLELYVENLVDNKQISEEAAADIMDFYFPNK